jgi:hypothetical protein
MQEVANALKRWDYRCRYRVGVTSVRDVARGAGTMRYGAALPKGSVGWGIILAASQRPAKGKRSESQTGRGTEDSADDGHAEQE